MYEHARTVDLGDLQMLVAEDGPAAGVPVLLLHGWPDTARLWRNQADVLGEAGYRVLAPDLVGRGGSHRPSDVARYRVMASVGDMINLLDNAGIEQAHLVGHDWGASVAWAMALTNPHRVHSLTALSVGHPNAWEAGGAEQLRRSWYMFLFQFEGVAEELLVKDDWAMFRALADDHSEVTAWIEDLSRPFALTASLNWYRANARAEQLLSRRRSFPSVQVPTLGVWSSGDAYLTEAQMVTSGDHVDAEWRYERIDEASHWIPLDAPDRLNTLLLDWFSILA